MLSLMIWLYIGQYLSTSTCTSVLCDSYLVYSSFLDITWVTGFLIGGKEVGFLNGFRIPPVKHICINKLCNAKRCISLTGEDYALVLSSMRHEICAPIHSHPPSQFIHIQTPLMGL